MAVVTLDRSVFFVLSSVFLFSRTLGWLGYILRASVLQQILGLKMFHSQEARSASVLRLTKYWMGSEGLLVLTALRAGRSWGTTSWSKYCLLVMLLISWILFGFLGSGSSPAMV